MGTGILRGLFDYFEDVSVIDITEDKISKLAIQGNQFVIKETKSYTDYVNNLPQVLKESDLANYMSASSISSLEASYASGKNGSCVTYETMDGKKKRTIFLLDAMDSKRNIYAFTEPATDTENTSQSLMNVTNLVSDAVLKIYNVFEANTSSNLRIDDVETYINAILTNLTSNYKELKQTLTKKAINLSGQSGKSIMIVDDDMVTRTMLKKIFMDEYQIIEAKNGKEAIDIIKNNSNSSNIKRSRIFFLT